MTGSTARYERLHSTIIVSDPDGTTHIAMCDTPGCGWTGVERDSRRHLAESDADEHRRAKSNWPDQVIDG